MSSIEVCDPPLDAFLRRYLHDGAYVDCYATDVPHTVRQADYVAAFYTTWLFRIERAILKAVDRPSLDGEAEQLGLGTRDHFAAWRVEERSDRQLLLCDYTGNTRSWLMSEPLPGASGPGTRLYFGSAVVHRTDPVTGQTAIGATYRALLGFHKVYSRMLLRAASNRLRSGLR